MTRGFGCLLVLIAISAAALFFGRGYVRDHPQDFPWTELSLAHPAGTFTAGKIAALGDEPARCRTLLAETPVGDSAAPDRLAPPDCGYRDGMRLSGRSADYEPAGLVTSCPAAAALHLFETRVVQPAARRRFGRPVTAIDHAGSYSCRRIYGRADGRFSEHATADAVDIVGFRLAGGKRVSVVSDWDGGGSEAAFLRDVRDGACDYFSTVLSPDYNAAHRDHLHLDVAMRGSMTWTMCR